MKPQSRRNGDASTKKRKGTMHGATAEWINDTRTDFRLRLAMHWDGLLDGHDMD